MTTPTVRNNPTRIDYPDPSYVSFAYNDSGARTQMVDSTGTTTYAYDDLYRLTSVTYPGPSTTTHDFGPRPPPGDGGRRGDNDLRLQRRRPPWGGHAAEARPAPSPTPWGPTRGGLTGEAAIRSLGTKGTAWSRPR
ncbi:MAG: RHS repeat protein [Dehalococcoidia bacterium]|nr:RHS repeat protein [Dehalococcoidia bacterium]